MRRIHGSLAALALLIGCGGDTTTPDELPDLVIDETDTLTEGSLYVAGTRVAFRSENVEPRVYDITVRFNALTISALVDSARGVSEFDGYATDSGAETVMTEADRAVLLAFTRGLDELGLEVAAPTDMLRRFTSVWAEFPDTLELRRQTIAETTREYWSLCAYVNNYFSAHHDCSTCDWGQDACTLGTVTVGSTWTYYTGVGSWLGMDAACPYADGTNFWSGSSWSCYEPNHATTPEYAYGNCFGRCGASCGSSKQFTEDCNNHDQCVRTGHDTASMYCNDQFISTTDDWSEAPNCNNAY